MKTSRENAVRSCTSARLKVARVAILVFCACSSAAAGTLTGTVRNGTNGQLAAGVDVTLIQLSGGMQPVANTKTDPQGQFTFTHPDIGAAPMLVRAIYHGVNFNQPVPPGTSSMQVEILESSTDVKTINVPIHVVIFQPHGANLIVGEEFQIENKSQPPQAYFRPDGNFDFTLPENARLQQVAAVGPSGMQVVQSPIDKKQNRYAIAFAFRPGQSVVRYSYQLSYPGNSATIKIPTVYSEGRFLVVAPPSVQITGDGLVSRGQERGMSLYDRQDVPAGTLSTVSVSGTAPLQEPNGGAGQEQQSRNAKQGGGPAGADAQPVPARLDALKWPLIVGFVLLFGLAGVLLARKRTVVVTTEKADEDTSLPMPRNSNSVITSPISLVAPGASSNGTAGLVDVDAAVSTSLDLLKDQLFRLELRRQAGTITQIEYAQERERAEKVLRDLVRG
ncbi:MAG TPA: carboxypeptidase-like regulatory domain-containing protein [Candidatus Sulfotelmatobacter sp.]|nr:carboxypeptidase-like regulatory domain-containing protein [Candidatus Sulfotelmatobacter sp.]